MRRTILNEMSLLDGTLCLNGVVCSCGATHSRMVKRGIKPTVDREIDKLVYELYGLSEEVPKMRGCKIKIVEGE